MRFTFNVERIDAERATCAGVAMVFRWRYLWDHRTTSMPFVRQYRSWNERVSALNDENRMPDGCANIRNAVRQRMLLPECADC